MIDGKFDSWWQECSFKSSAVTGAIPISGKARVEMPEWILLSVRLTWIKRLRSVLQIRADVISNEKENCSLMTSIKSYRMMDS